MNKARTYKWFLIAVGIISVGLGLLGVFIPVLPTTPFLLLAAGCFMRSSQRLYDWLIHHKWFGEYIRNYREGKGMPLKAKVFTILLLWLTIGYAAVFITSLWWLKILLVGIALGVTVHLVKIKTYRPDVEQTGSIRECDSPEELA